MDTVGEGVMAFLSALLRVWVGVTAAFLLFAIGLAPVWLLAWAIFYFTVN